MRRPLSFSFVLCSLINSFVCCFSPCLKRTVSTEGSDATKDTQKKKRKGRNKQEVVSISQAEPEPEVVKTPIDLVKVCVS